MREHLATLLDDFRRFDRQIAVVRHLGNRRRVSTYGEIAGLAGRFAALLASRGVGPGDRVLLWAENSAEWIAAFYGILLRGALAVPLDAYGTPEFAARVAADVRPSLAVGDALLLHTLPGDWPRIAFEEWPEALPATELGPVEGLSLSTPLQILFTSGTTGEPKGVVLTHGNVLASVEPIESGAQPYLRYERLIHPLRILHTLPLSHVFGQTMGLWVPPILAAEVHFESRLVAARLIETIRRERISVLAAVPRVFSLLKAHLEAADPALAAKVGRSAKSGPLLRWLRFRRIHRSFGLKFWALVSGGGALPAAVEHFFNRLGFVVIQGYGMTETSALITLNHPFHVAQGSIGKPLPGREVKLGADGEVLVRGATISTATWQGGSLRARAGEWLATGDLAEAQPGGELRFIGRKSEVIVTASGVNLHPEDLEAAIEQEPAVAACAVVPMATPSGPEACAVLAMRGSGAGAAAAMERANARLADFQRVRRWVLWPEPDLPRTSTGKVRRKPVEAWLEGIRAAASAAGMANAASRGAFGASSDWLLRLISEITGEMPPGIGDELRLDEDLGLDSLSRVQLGSALEERTGLSVESELLDTARTLGELRALVAGESAGISISAAALDGPPADDALSAAGLGAEELAGSTAPRYVYPRWPWSKPVVWLRIAFIEAVLRPLVWFLAAPRIEFEQPLHAAEPLFIVANHVTAYDGALIQYALPAALRRRMAAAMAASMLDDYRHFRNPEREPGQKGFMLLGPLAWLLLTALFNVFPLPRRRNFQQSFAHAGRALDRGFNVLVFPEGTRSADGRLARFRGGIELLVRQSGARVLPVALRGLGGLKTGSRSWFRSGAIEVRVGSPIRFAPEETEIEIGQRLESEVARLLKGARDEDSER